MILPWLHRGVMIFSIIFTLFAGSIFITPLFSKPNKQITEFLNDDLTKETLSQEEYEDLENMIKPQKMDWNDLLFLTAPYLMCTIFFNVEARIVKNKLKLILKSENNIC
ncbi:MAG: hypothetical protein L3J09_03355 [Flavobacteriaceae bacterium]|nr:hypothetical protein [Flavobacteriaceae bacterium]